LRTPPRGCSQNIFIYIILSPKTRQGESMARFFLREADWAKLSELLPSQKGKRGRPRRNDRLVIEGILWVLRTGAPWRDIPKEFGPWTTIANRYSRWTKSGVWEQMWGILKKKCRQRISYGGLFDN
jgi:transposase